MSDKDKSAEGRQDRSTCLRCQGELKELPTPPDQAGIGTTINVYACTKCGKMEFFMEVLQDGKQD